MWSQRNHGQRYGQAHTGYGSAGPDPKRPRIGGVNTNAAPKRQAWQAAPKKQSFTPPPPPAPKRQAKFSGGRQPEAQWDDASRLMAAMIAQANEQEEEDEGEEACEDDPEAEAADEEFPEDWDQPGEDVEEDPGNEVEDAGQEGEDQEAAEVEEGEEVEAEAEEEDDEFGIFAQAEEAEPALAQTASSKIQPHWQRASPQQQASIPSWQSQNSQQQSWKGGKGKACGGKGKPDAMTFRRPKKAAKLPEALGFNVSHGVVRKGWEIGEMEDGIRPSEDGEPDIFLSHSYSSNCRRVDMALFECDCPNSLTCCSHAYAGLVALPNYRHRCALLWALRQEVEKKTSGGDFEASRERLRVQMLQRLPLDDLVDAAIDACIGMWSRISWLRAGRKPKMAAYWADSVERALKNLNKKAEAEDEEAGEAARKRLGAFLSKLQMKKTELEPLLQALGDGNCGDAPHLKQTQQHQARWTKLCKSVWAYVAGNAAEEKKQSSTGVSVDELRSAVCLAVNDSKDDVPDWAIWKPVERIWHVESVVLASLGVQTFPELSIPRDGSRKAASASKGKKESAPDTYRSFVEFLSEWPEAPEELMEGGKPAESGGGAGVELVEREAAALLEEIGREALKIEGGKDALAAMLNMHFGHLGDSADWTDVAGRALEAPPVEDAWRQRAILSAKGTAWEPEVAIADQSLLVGLAAEGWEVAAARLVAAAPPLAELRAWLLWDAVFEPQLGPLRAFLRRSAGGLGIAAFELDNGEVIKLDAAAGTTENWEAALAACDALRAAEALLALCHGCGSIRNATLQDALGPSYARAAAEVEGFAEMAGEILGHLPSSYARSPTLVQFLLRPLSTSEQSCRDFASAAGPLLAEHAALFCRGLPVASVLGKDAVARLTTTDGAKVSRMAPVRKRSVVQRVPLAEATQQSEANLPLKPQEATKEVVATASSSSADADKPSSASGTSTVHRPTSEPAASAMLELPADPAEALVVTIRREEFGFEGEVLGGGALQAKQNARLARALKRLAGELYGSDVHWQLELLQNADDNTYNPGQSPTAEFLLRQGEVCFRCNESGFRASDIRAICDIGNSSKVGVAKYSAGGRVMATGEKGLGFKAVFALTDAPRIYSGPYRIEFDCKHPSGIGYVLPRWLHKEAAPDADELLASGKWGSALRMPLRAELLPTQAELFVRLEELPPSLLLFLKTLREVAVIDDTPDGAGGIRIRRVDEADADDGEVRWREGTTRAQLEIERAGMAVQDTWLLMRRRFQVPAGVAKPGISQPPATTLLEVALPLNEDGAFDQSRGVQPVFAFLPVRPFGFNFALQADWAVSSSREDLLAGCAWNEFLKAQLPKILIELVEEVKREPLDSPLRHSFYAVVPPLATTPPFFRPAVAQLHAGLRQHECMLTDDDSFCIPRLALRGSAEVRLAFGRLGAGVVTDSEKATGTNEPMESKDAKPEMAASPLRAALRSQGLYFVHEKVESSVPAGLLDSLGVQRFSAAHLLRLLPVAAESHPEFAWWRRALGLLDELLDSAPRADVTRLTDVAKKMQLLPLEGGAWSSADAGVFLPPAAEEAKGFPKVLLAELRAVDPQLLAEGEDALLAARLRKLLRRLGVTPLTPRQVLRDVIGPMFHQCSAPCVIPMSAAPKSSETLLAFAGFIVTHLELADELSGPVGWPMRGLAEVAVGRRFSAPTLHSPRAACFLEALQGSPVVSRMPAPPAGLNKSSSLGEALETLGLALPGPLVEAAASGDWRSPEFEKLVAFCTSEKGSAGQTRARFLAQSFDSTWARYERYACRGDGTASSFMVALQKTAWLPADSSECVDIDVEREEEEDREPRCSLHKPDDLCISTPALQSVFTDAALLAGRVTTAVSGRFAEVLGVRREPSASLALSILRGFCRRSPVGPEAAAAVYGYLEREGADLAALKKFPSIVVAASKSGMLPSDVVWEDVGSACGITALLPLYSTRYRTFFVKGLGVPERPTGEQALNRVDQLTGSLKDGKVDMTALWTVLLFIAERTEAAKVSSMASKGAANAEAQDVAGQLAEWTAAAEGLRPRRCLPLEGADLLGAPNQGIVYADDCVRVPPKVLEAIRSNLSIAAMPPAGARSSAAWLPLLRIVGLRPISEACLVTAKYAAAAPDAALGAAVAALLPFAQRYLFHKHRGVHDSMAGLVSSRVRGLCVRQVKRPLQLLCTVTVCEGDLPATTTTVDVDAFLEDGQQSESTDGSQLLAATDVSLPSVCIELARLLVPPVAGDGAAAARHAREAITTFLTSVCAGGAEAAENLCQALGIGEAPPEEIRWPTPAEVEAQAAAEAAADAEAMEAMEAASREAASEDGESENPKKRRRTDVEVVDVQGGTNSDDRSVQEDQIGDGKDGKEGAESGSLKGGKGGKDGKGKKNVGHDGEGSVELIADGDGSKEGVGSEGTEKGKGKEGKGTEKGKGKEGKGEGKDDGKGKGKGDGKGKGKGKDGGKAERDAGEIGDIFSGFEEKEERPQSDSTQELGEKPPKVFKTRVYDLEKVREKVMKKDLPDIPADNNTLTKEAREKVGRWGEQFVFNYLKHKFESEGEASESKRVVWVNETEETGFQYDVRVEDKYTGEVEAYVEVKTTQARDKQLFEMSYREWNFAQKEANKFVIFRVMNAGKRDVELCSITNPFRQWKDMNLGMCLTL